MRVVGWYSAYCTRTVGVTLTYADTLTRGGEGGRVVILRTVRLLSELL